MFAITLPTFLSFSRFSIQCFVVVFWLSGIFPPDERHGDFWIQASGFPVRTWVTLSLFGHPFDCHQLFFFSFFLAF